MTDLKPAVLGVQLADDGITLAYVKPTDPKDNGVLFQHSVFVPSGSDYDDELEAVHDALYALLADVLEDEPNLQPAFVATDSEDEGDSLFTFVEEPVVTP